MIARPQANPQRADILPETLSNLADDLVQE